MRVSLIALAAGALGLSACAADLESEPGLEVAGASSSSRDVAVVAQALGGFEEIWSGETPIDLGTGFAVFKNAVQPCPQPTVLPTQQGTPWVQFNNAILGCPVITAAGSSNLSGGMVAVGDSVNHKIHLGLLVGANYEWREIAMGTGDSISKILVGPDRVYWQDTIGIRAVSLPFGGWIATLSNGAQPKLLGLEGNKDLYVETFVQIGSNYQFELGRLSGDTGVVQTLATNSVTFSTGFTFDANHFYWTEGTGPNGTTHRLRRVAKTGGTPETYLSSTSARYYSPLSDGAFLWWQQDDLVAGTSKLRRRNLTNLNYVQVDFPIPDHPKMLLMPDNIYMMGVLVAPDYVGYGRTPR